MECKYREKDYCTYSNRDCNPKAYSCYMTHKPKNYVVAPQLKTSQTDSHPINNDNELFPQRYDKTVATHGQTAVYVYGGVLKIKKNRLKDYKIIVSDIVDPSRKYSLYVICNTNSGYYYMGQKVLKYYMKKGYHPNVIFKYANPSECTKPISHIDMSEFSILKMYGYSVGKNGLSKQQRHELLGYILDNKIMKGFDIINLLQFNIAMREGKNKFEHALNDWQTDIEFVTNYFD